MVLWAIWQSKREDRGLDLAHAQTGGVAGARGAQATAVLHRPSRTEGEK